MASSFPTAVDVIPDAGPTLPAVGRSHSFLHNKMRDGLVAVQGYVLTELSRVKANGWVTGQRIADRAVSDRHVSSVGAAKIIGTITNAISSSGVVQGTSLRAGAAGHNPAFRVQEYSGTLNSVGELVVSHAVTNGHLRAMGGWGWYEGTNGELRPLEIVSINSTGFHIRKSGLAENPPAANAKYKAYLMHRESNLSW